MFNLTVHVRAVGMVQHQFTFSDETTVLQLKEEIYQKIRAPVKCQILSFGCVMDDEKKLTDYEVINGSSLFLSIGAPPGVESTKSEMSEFFNSYKLKRYSEILNSGSINKIPFEVGLENQNFQVLNRKKSSFFDETVADIFTYANLTNEYTEGKSVISDCFILLSKNLTWNDLFILRENSSPTEVRNLIVRLRPLLQTFITSRLLEEKEAENFNIIRACEQICSEMEPYLVIMREVRLVESIEAVGTIINFSKAQFTEIIKDILRPSIDDEDFQERMTKSFSNYFRKLFAIILHCCQDGHLGLDSIVRGFIRLFKRNTSEACILMLEFGVLVVFRLRSFVRDLDVPLEEIKPYFVLCEKQAIVETREEPNETISLPTEEWIVVKNRKRRLRINPDRQVGDKIKTKTEFYPKQDRFQKRHK